MIGKLAMCLENQCCLNRNVGITSLVGQATFVGENSPHAGFENVGNIVDGASLDIFLQEFSNGARSTGSDCAGTRREGVKLVVSLRTPKDRKERFCDFDSPFDGRNCSIRLVGFCDTKKTAE